MTMFANIANFFILAMTPNKTITRDFSATRLSAPQLYVNGSKGSIPEFQPYDPERPQCGNTGYSHFQFLNDRAATTLNVSFILQALP